MKRSKLLDLIAQVRAETLAEGSRPVTFDNLTVDFPSKTISFKGRTIKVDANACVFPVISTDALIVTKDGEVIR